MVNGYPLGVSLGVAAKLLAAPLVPKPGAPFHVLMPTHHTEAARLGRPAAHR